MHKQTRSIALSAPTVSPVLWMTLLLFLLATAMMGCEPEVVDDPEVAPPEDPEEPEDPEDDEDNEDNDENDEDSALLRDSGLGLARA